MTYGNELLEKAQKANEELGNPIRDFIVIDGKAKGPNVFSFSDVVKSSDLCQFPKVKIDPAKDVAILPYRCVVVTSLPSAPFSLYSLSPVVKLVSSPDKNHCLVVKVFILRGPD